MAKKQVSDTTKVSPRYIMTNKDKEHMKNTNERSFLSNNDTTKMKNMANVKSDESLLKRNVERQGEGKLPLKKSNATLYAKDLDPKKYKAIQNKK